MSMEIIDWVNLNVKQENHGENPEIIHRISDALKEKLIVSQIIEKIKNGEVKSVLLSYMNRGVCTTRQMRKEIKLYCDSFNKFSDEKLIEFNNMISKYHILPSTSLNELTAKDEVLSEDPEIRQLMVLSLQNGIRPSVIMREKAEYQKMATIENKEWKDFILYYLQEWILPKLVEEEYENYKDIKNYDYKDENLKKFVLWLIRDEGVNPSLIELYFDLFKDKEFWEETEIYIRWLINQPKK